MTEISRPLKGQVRQAESRPKSDDLRRRLPAVGRLLENPAVANLIALYGRDQVRVQARRELDELRSALNQLESLDTDERTRLETRIETLDRNPLSALTRQLEMALGRPLRRVINATGIFLHTNLGRAPLPRDIAATLPPLLDAYCDLELDLASGQRGDRNRRVGRLLAALTEAPAGLVVNNNAAAMILVLSVLAKGREVIVSRGELVEIGGSFRIPDILEMSGARLVEVGTTNRTRIDDYARRICDDTALLLKVFPSNYRIEGFTESASPRQLAELARQHGLPLLVDEGSGLAKPHPAPQLREHPSLQELMRHGCDLACGSGDKLLGGPQAGLLVGREDLIQRCRRHPLYRALRPDRTVLASLEAVLRRHLAGDAMPLDRLWPEPTEHRRRLESFANELHATTGEAGVRVEMLEVDAYLGGGSAPESPIPGLALSLQRAALQTTALQTDSSSGGSPVCDSSLDRLALRLRTGEPAVMGYQRDGKLILDLRTVDPRDDSALLRAVVAAVTPAPSD